MRDWVEWLVCGVIVVLIPLCIYGMILNDREWESYRIAHACKVVAKISGSTAIGVGPVIGGNNGGVSVTVIPIAEKTGWLCDDGITYYR